jgi:hypothetical protein
VAACATRWLQLRAELNGISGALAPAVGLNFDFIAPVYCWDWRGAFREVRNWCCILESEGIMPISGYFDKNRRESRMPKNGGDRPGVEVSPAP